MRRVFPMLALCGILAAAALSPDEAGSGWVALDQTDWGKLVFADFIVRFEMKAASPGATGSLLVRTALEGNPKETGYEIQLGPGNSAWPSGSVVDHARAASGSQPLGQWLPFEVEAVGGKLTVRVFDRTVATAGGLLGQAGLLVLLRGVGIDVRNPRIRPVGGQELFNGTDLTGWKSTGTQPKPGGLLSKVLGKKKPKEAKWTVSNGTIHGEDGPGQLESAAPHGDFILQTLVRVPKRRMALLIRGDAGQIGTGYEISIQSAATGGITALAPQRTAMGVAGEFAMLTIAAQNRRFQVWVDGTPVAVADDVRPEGPNPRKDARTTPGVVAFYTPEDHLEVEVRSARIADLPKALGHTRPGAPVAAAPAPVPSAPAAPAATPAPAPAGSTPQVDVLQQQIQTQQNDRAQQDQKQQKVSALLQQALKSKSPEEQVSLYDQILALDPNNQVAFNARKDAQAKIDAAAEKAGQKAEVERKASGEQVHKQQQFAEAARNAQDAFLRGDLNGAGQALSVAEKIAPGDPAMQALRRAIDAARARRDSSLAIAGAALLAVLVAGAVFFVKRRGKKAPYLEILSGLDKGKKFNIDQELLHLGAIEQDGGEKNDIVLRDAERMVSRFHAQILSRQGRLFLLDVGSANGTFLDKKRVSARKPYPLKNGSRVNFGGTCLVRIGYEKRS